MGATPPQVDRAAGGLSSAEARRLLAEVGPNAIAAAPGPPALRQFLAKLTGLFALLLWVGAALALAVGTPELSAAIVAVILVNAVFSFFQEHRAQRALAALQEVLPLRVRVRRDGRVVEVPNEEVVPGDVLVLAPGDRIAGDAELLLAQDLRVDASVLTGESEPQSPSERVFAGTYVVAGAAEALVTATGMRTRFGRVAALTQRARRQRSPLERELDRVTRVIALLAVSVGAAFFVVAGALGIELVDRLVFAIGVTVALVPEGLLPTVTLSLAMATRRMAERNALVRRLSSVETLGETTVICTDKTGTLTRNEMTVQRLWAPGCGELVVEGAGYEPEGRILRDGEPVDPGTVAELLRAGAVCNDARLERRGRDGGWAVVGDPTEGALLALAGKGGIGIAADELPPRLHEFPFSSERMRMTTVNLVDGRRVAYTKGAVEAVLPLTSLGRAARERVAAQADRMEREALRVLALARRPLEGGVGEGPEQVERELEFLGLVGMIDPPRPGVAEAIARCRTAGIRVLMVTGDSAPTAAAIARRVGLVRGEPEVITGRELDRLDDAALRRRLEAKEVVFARIEPQQKLRLATVLREAGEVVAMTGDGVNDAPALKHADIGVAMGRNGTEVAKQAADMVLVDDNFATIVAAVEEGRAVFRNIRRFTGYHLCSNVGELLPFLAWGVSGGAIPLPLVVMQVLAIDLGTDMIPALALGTERAEPGTMERPPRPRSERLLNREVFARVGGLGGLEGMAALLGFLFAYWLSGWRPWEGLADAGTTYLEATTMTMAAIMMGQVGAGLAWRSDRLPLRRLGPFSNRLLLAGIAIELALLLILVYAPGLGEVFHTASLEARHWLFLLAWPFVILGVGEVGKALARRRDARTAGAGVGRLAERAA